MSFAMASHAVRMLWLNRWDALRLTAVPYLVVQAITIGLPLMMLGSLGPDSMGEFQVVTLEDSGQQEVAMPEGLGEFFLVQLLVLIGSIIAGAWLAVVWHRFVLLEEYPNGAIPPFSTPLVFGYVWKLILIGLAALFVGGISGLLIGGLGAVAAPIFAVFGIAWVLGMIWFMVRLSVALPAAAVAHSMKLRDAWQATSEVHGAMFGATILIAILGLVVSIPALLGAFVFGAVDGTTITPIGIAINVACGWVATMLTVSLATTMYGVAVEGRDLS